MIATYYASNGGGGQIIADKVLLRSAPIIFTALADALQWIMARKGVHPIAHYLDDFITLGPPPFATMLPQPRGYHSNLQLHGHSPGRKQMRGPSPHVPRNGTGLNKNGNTSPDRQTSVPSTSIIRMGGTQVGHEERVAVPHWVLATRLQGGTSGPLVPTEADHTLHSSSTS